MSDKTNPEVSVVPTHPTEDMILAGWDAGSPDLPSTNAVIAIWSAMLAAARLAHQTPPATQPSATVGEDQPYPASQLEARFADGWRFHYGSRCPADCDEVYYRRKMHPDEALGPTPPHLIRWTDTGDGSDILAWHPVYAGFQRRHRLTTLHTPPPVATATVVDDDEDWTRGRAWPEMLEAVAQYWSNWEDERAGTGAYTAEELAEDAGHFANGLADYLAATPTPPAGDR